MRTKARRGLSLVLSLLIVVSMMAVSAPAIAAEDCGCTACGEWQEYPLYAAQDWQVGVVRVNNCADKVGVEYVLFDEVTDEGWRITETHLAVEDSLADIPQTKKNNPIPGQFENSRYYEEGVMSDLYCLDREAGWEIGTPLYIAAHAVVGLPAESHVEERSFCATSSPAASVIKAGMDPAPASLAWVHPLWNSSLTMPLYEDASWIWESYRPINPVDGDIVEFSHEFEIEGTPTSAMLYITADNAFEVAVNTTVVGDSGNLFGDWRNSDLTEPFVDTSGGVASWATVRSFDVSALLATGTNELAVTGVNEQMNGGTVDSNPGGVIYKLCGISEVEILDREAAEETAWGGEEDFDGKNWATYFVYEIQGCCTPCVAPFYPFQVIDSEQGLRKDSSPVNAGRSNPDAVLQYNTAQAESSFFTLGFGGYLIGEFECPVPNGEGDDFRVIEDTWGSNYPLEKADVFVSQDGETWTKLGVADNTSHGTTLHTESYFDLDGSGLEWFKFVKVVDTTDPAVHAASGDGYDLNTIEALHDSQSCQ